jgi:hypothetical protein
MYDSLIAKIFHLFTHILTALFLVVDEVPSLADARDASQIVILQELRTEERECIRIVYAACKVHVTM